MAAMSETLQAASEDFTISRVFDARRDRVWKAWTEAGRLAQWWGPKGSAIRVLTFDLRLDGIFHYAMQVQPGHQMYGRFVYREVSPPVRLMFVSSFSDAAGGVTRAPFNANWPLEVRNVLTLAERDGRTTLDLRGGPVAASGHERGAFVAMFDSMRRGFAGTFDQLAACLAKP